MLKFYAHIMITTNYRKVLIKFLANIWNINKIIQYSFSILVFEHSVYKRISPCTLSYYYVIVQHQFQLKRVQIYVSE